MRMGLDRIGGKLDRSSQSTELCRHQRFAGNGEVPIIAYAPRIPANNNKPAWLDHRCKRADCRLGTLRIIDAVSEHAIHDRRVEKTGCDLLIERAYIANDMSARHTPTHCGRINVDGPEREAQAPTCPRDLPIVTLDPDKQQVCAIGADEQRQQGLMDEPARRKVFDPAMEPRVMEPLPDPLRDDRARNPCHTCIQFSLHAATEPARDRARATRQG
jgi:hypothetical protein